MYSVNWDQKKLAANNPYAPNNGGQNPFGRSAAPTNTGDNTNIFGQSVGGGAATQAPLVAQRRIVVTNYQMVANLLLSYALLVSVLTTFSQSIVQVTLKKFVVT